MKFIEKKREESEYLMPLGELFNDGTMECEILWNNC